MRLRVTLQTITHIIEDIDEYVCGHKYFHVLCKETSQFFFPRHDILCVERLYADGSEKTVHLKKIPLHSLEKSNDDIC